MLVPPHSEFVAPRLITPQFITSPPPYFIVPHAGDVAFEVGRSPCGHEVHDAGGQLVVQGQKRHGQIRQGDEAQGLHRKNPRGLHEEAQQRRQAHQAGLFLGGSTSLLRRASYRFALPCHAIPRGERSVLVSEGFCCSCFFLYFCVACAHCCSWPVMLAVFWSGRAACVGAVWSVSRRFVSRSCLPKVVVLLLVLCWWCCCWL